MKKVMSLIVAFALLVVMLPIQANAVEITASGTCGDNLTWTLDEEGTLSISGTGPMDNWGPYFAPWYDAQDAFTYIKKIISTNLALFQKF